MKAKPGLATRTKLATAKPVAPARTQVQRREATIGKLLHAATEALIDVGYARSSVQEICARAEVSHGGLFRHFPTRLALMKRVAEDLGDSLLDRYRQQFERLNKSGREPIRLALELCRGNCQSRPHQAWFELMMAARTDAELRATLAPIWARNHSDVLALARQLLPDYAGHPAFAATVDLIVTLLHGEAVERFVRIDGASETRRLDWAEAAIAQRLR